MNILPIDEAICSIVTGDAACAALIETEFYAGTAPQSVDVDIRPYCVYGFSGGGYSHSLTGRDGDVARTLTVLGFCATEKGRMALAKALVDALDPVAGPWPKTVTVSGSSVAIQKCSIQEGDDGEKFAEYSKEEGGEVSIYGFEQTYDVAYTA